MSAQLIKDDVENFKDNEYATSGSEPIPVQKDDAKLEDPISGDQDTDAQLSKPSVSSPLKLALTPGRP